MPDLSLLVLLVIAPFAAATVLIIAAVVNAWLDERDTRQRARCVQDVETRMEDRAFRSWDASDDLADIVPLERKPAGPVRRGPGWMR